MLPISLLALLAAAAIATPINEPLEQTTGSVSSVPFELDTRSTEIVVGDETDAALWSEPGDTELEARQVNYRCFNSGVSVGAMKSEIESACGYLQGGYATNQEKKACRNFSATIRVNFAIRNMVGGRGHDYAACVDRLTAIDKRCPFGGRVNRANWECLYEKLRDPACSRMIELGAKLGDPESIEAWDKIQKLPSLPLAGDRSPNKYLRALHGLWQTLTLGPSLDKPVSSSERLIAHAGDAPPSSFVSRVDQYNKSRCFRIMANSSLRSFGSLPPSHRYSNDLTPAKLFQVMFTSFTTRNLTRLEDEAVCLATTLGTDIDAILRESSPEEQIRILLTSIGTLPLSILFIQSERLHGDNCRWIPRTLLRRGAKVVEGSCQCQPYGRLMYQGRALISTRPFAINKTGSYFTIEAINGKQCFVGIQPQPGLDIEDGEKRYLIIPSRPALGRDHVPQEVAILVVNGKRFYQNRRIVG
ncbi:hypothetical protein FMUND_15267 [Fusarium mundagurra]|uniref:Uncharacterized protein n=1 Tax=Fusarium mundagurra TaxID=1567541 RepID=A0A8H5XQQ8_9HYPO|nr:hypothetical protein FMUND_15267 [Fusarium mundagurra]